MSKIEDGKESSISVAVRIRPLTPEEKIYLEDDDDDDEDHTNDDVYRYYNENRNNLENKENLQRHKKQRSHNIFTKPFVIKKILDVVDDRMLIFDPKPSSVDDYDDSSSLRQISHQGKRRNVSGKGLRNHNNRHKEHKFIFDKLFDENSTQNEIYETTTKPSIDAVLEGYNSTIFAYGATGCGKTYTISGTPENPGIIFLALQELFAKIGQQTEKDISVQVSYLEIYNETIKDLLNLGTNPRSLTILENEHKEILVSNLTKVDTSNVDDVMDVIIKGNYNRTVSPTEANLTSSRSHAVLQVYVTQAPHVTDIYEKNTRSVLSIIDLAGSERASATKNKGVRLHEGANINKSLLALGNCINALCDSRRSKHIPYRDSKLTRLLKFSLGGNCKTVMIVCVSPSSRHYDETLNALKFANRAKEIKTKVVKNRTTVMKHVGSYMKIISDQKRKIYELETLMDSTVKREVSKYIEKRNYVKSQFKLMIDRLWNNVSKCETLKSNKIFIVAKRKLLMMYIKQLNDFYLNLDKFDIENRTNDLKFHLIQIIDNMKTQVNLLEEEYNQRTELDVILLDTSESFLKRLRELDGWNENDEQLYTREIEYLKTDIEKQIFYESSVLFDSWIADSSNNNDTLSSIIAQYLCAIETIASSMQSLEDGRMQCYKLSDNIIQNCIHQLTNEVELYPSDLIQMNNRKRRNSGQGNVSDAEELAIDTSFVRQGNRISSINNKLMRINLNNSSTDFKDPNTDTFSEMETSCILENGQPSNVKMNVNTNNIRSSSQSQTQSRAQSLLLQSESTPQKNDDINELNYLSPSKPDRDATIKNIDTIPEWDESNSSVIIRKGATTINDKNIVNEGKVLPETLGSPFEFFNSMNKANVEIEEGSSLSDSPSPSTMRKNRRVSCGGGNNMKLTNKKLPASPRINSPYRLVGLDSNSSNMFQFKIRESMGNVKLPVSPVRGDIEIKDADIGGIMDLDASKS